MAIKPGQNLGQYRIIEQIGRGGMASVYRGSQPSLSRQVAIKVLPEFFAEDPAFHERFLQEAMSVASLRHPNILTVFDSGEIDGVPFMVMELLDGGSLSDKLGKPLPIDYCIKVAKAVGAALDYAHSRGMVHRDVKPGNILMASDGTPILTDFGLARMMSHENDATRLTMSGTTLGTPHYMAPEQVSNSDVGPSADLYALAVIVYEMLTGSVPYFDDTSLVSILARKSQPVPLPRDRNPNIPEPLQTALLKGLAVAPAARYGTAGEMVQALEMSMQRASTVSNVQSPPAAGPAAATPSRKRSVAGVTGICVFVAVLIAVWGWSRTRPAAAVPGASVETAKVSAPVEGPPATANSVSASPATPPVASDKTTLVAAAGDVNTSSRGSDGLPPHGKLMYSISSSLADLAALPQRNPEDKIEVKDGALEFTTGSDAGANAALPVYGLANFVAVLRFTASSRKPILQLRFHETPKYEGHGVRIPAYLRIRTPAEDAQPVGPHKCCQDLDILKFTGAPPNSSIFTGPLPLSSPAAANEEEVVAISVKGMDIVVYEGGHEIAHASDSSYGAGRMTLMVQAAPIQRPAVLRLKAFDVYDATGAISSPSFGSLASSSSGSNAAKLPAHGKLLYSMAMSLSDIASTRLQNPEDAIAVKGGKLEFTVADDMGIVVPLPINGLGNFVAVLRYVTTPRSSKLILRFHRPTGPGGHTVQLPSYLHLSPPASGAPPTGQHSCCQDFDIYVAPLKIGDFSLLTGPQIMGVQAAVNEEQSIVVSVKGPSIVVYSDGQEIARTSDGSFGPGGMNIQIMPRIKGQFPAMLQLSAFEVYEAP